MNELLHHALEAESQLAEEAQFKTRAAPGHFPPRSTPYTPAASAPAADRPSTSSKPASTVSNSKRPASAASGTGSNMSTARSSQVECHTCGGRGHYRRDCPNKKAVLLSEENAYETGDDADPYASDDDLGTDHDDDAGIDAMPDRKSVV